MNLINLTTSEYPFSLWQLRRDNPNVSFPANPTDDDIELFGCRFVHPSDQPAFNPRSEQIEELPPEPDADGVYSQRWQVIPASPEHIAAWMPPTPRRLTGRGSRLPFCRTLPPTPPWPRPCRWPPAPCWPCRQP